MWDHEYNTLRRENLFRNPPTDRSAYPLLQIAVNPHIESFNALFPTDGRTGLIAHGLADIGTKTFYDSPDGSSNGARNKLTVRYKSVSLQKSALPPSNKFAKNREIYPSECRERHATYRGKLTATLEYRINNGDPHEFVRELGNMPLMVKVRFLCASSWKPFIDHFLVEQMPPGRQLSSTACSEERRVRGARWLLYRERK